MAVAKKKEKSAAPQDKRAVIEASKMPEAQKAECIRQLGLSDSAPAEDQVPFAVYAKVRKLSHMMAQAMLAYPKAKGVHLSSLAGWDEIFKGF